MKKILVICHLDEKRFDGQQSKTNDVISAFKDNGFEVEILNYGKLSLFNLLPYSFKRIRQNTNILLMPGGKKALYFFLAISKYFKNKNFYYLAVGGWVTDLVKNKSSQRKLKPLHNFRSIVLQNHNAIEIFNNYGFNNVMYIPTFSSKQQLTEKEFDESLARFEKNKQYRFCFFARVEESKGVFEACNAIKKLAASNYDVKFDIYGQIQKKEIKDKLKTYLDDNIKYCGVLHDDCIKILSNYYCMLFPTYYKGEGMAHSIIESFMAGLPVIASDWKFNSELVKEGKTGFLVDLASLENNLYEKILFAIKNKEEIKTLRYNCYQKSKKFNSNLVLKPFIDIVDENNE